MPLEAALCIQTKYSYIRSTDFTAIMAMFKTGLTAIRPNEHLILNKEKQQVYVNGAINQYLLNHQITGVRFLYRNYERVRQIEYTIETMPYLYICKNSVSAQTIDFVFFFLFPSFHLMAQQTACILNDESGSGKCFQCIAFCDAILRLSKTLRILIVCQRYTSLEHWQFHIDCFLENVQTHIADNENDTQDDYTTNVITIASIDYVINNLSVFTANQMDCVILQDQQLEASFQSFERLNGIKTTHKIILGSNDLMV